MDSKTLNSHITEWMKASIVYQIGIGFSVTVLILILVLWIVIEIIHKRRRKEISIEVQKHQMDGLKLSQRLDEINNNKNKNNNNNVKSVEKPLLQRVVINNMNKNYQLTQNYIKMNNLTQTQPNIPVIEEDSDFVDGVPLPRKASIES